MSADYAQDAMKVLKTRLERPFGSSKTTPQLKRKARAMIRKQFHSICRLFHTTDTDSKTSQVAQVALLDLKFDDKGFSDWKWLLHHLDVLLVCNHISKPF